MDLILDQSLKPHVSIVTCDEDRARRIDELDPSKSGPKRRRNFSAEQLKIKNKALVVSSFPPSSLFPSTLTNLSSK